MQDESSAVSVGVKDRDDKRFSREEFTPEKEWFVSRTHTFNIIKLFFFFLNCSDDKHTALVCANRRVPGLEGNWLFNFFNKTWLCCLQVSEKALFKV